MLDFLKVNPLALLVSFLIVFSPFTPGDAGGPESVGDELPEIENVIEEKTQSTCALYSHAPSPAETANAASASDEGCNVKTWDDPDGDGTCTGCKSDGSGSSCKPCGAVFCTDPKESN